MNDYNKYSVHKLLYYILLISCFFPFLNILQLPIDSQPNSLIISFVIIFLNYKLIINKFPYKLTILFLILFIATLLLLFSKFSFETFSSYISYLSLCIVPLAAYISLKRLNGLSFNLFRNIILIWAFVAIIQILVNPEFLSFLQYRSSGSAQMGRGVNSLAPEPTYYGTVITLFIIIYFLNHFYENKSKLWIILLFIQLLIFSISTTIIAVFFISIFLYFLLDLLKFNFNIKFLITLILTILFFGILFYLYYDIVSETRLYKILEIVISNPDLVLLDESINERFNHAFFPIVNLFDNNLLPMGFGQFQTYIINKMSSPDYTMFFENINLEHYNKIMSGYGAAFFELGIFGILIPYFLYILFKKLFNMKITFFIFILLNMVLFTSISLNNALILFVFGNVMYLSIEISKK
jgi:hypothetical protein